MVRKVWFPEIGEVTCKEANGEEIDEDVAEEMIREFNCKAN